MTRSTVLLLVATLTSLAGGASAAELVTPPIQVTAGNSGVCLITNSSNKAREVTVEVRGGPSGNVIFTNGPVVLQPRRVFGAGSGDGPGFFYCRFIVEGPKSAFRASGGVCNTPCNGTSTAVLAAQ
ncbi:MAG: hypothetical protein AB1689_00110 [Thermodesulfobacteriota bacterium]